MKMMTTMSTLKTRRSWKSKVQLMHQLLTLKTNQQLKIKRRSRNSRSRSKRRKITVRRRNLLQRKRKRKQTMRGTQRLGKIAGLGWQLLMR